MKKIAIIFISALTLLALSSPLYAAGEQKVKTDPQQKNISARSMSAEELQGMQVVSEEGKKLGEIYRVHSDLESGQVQFVTVSQNGMSGEKVAIPLEALRFDRDKKQAILKVDESKLANAPKKEDKPTQVFLFELEKYYGVAPAWEKEAEIMGPPVPPVDLPEQQKNSE